jgi:exosortase
VLRVATVGGTGLADSKVAKAASVPLAVSPLAWARVGMLSAAFILLFWRWFETQGHHSIENLQDWGHAFAIPLISGYLAWRERDAILRTPVVAFWPGLCPLLLGVVSYFFFIVGVSNHMLQGAAMILALCGLVMLVGGPGLFRALFLPIAFLAFGVTISEQVMIKVTFQLQLLASHGSFLVLSVLAATKLFFVEVDGNTIKMLYEGREIPLNVAEACSGMRMVIAFLALGAAVAVLACQEWWQRILLVMLAIPVALLLNVVRVVVLALLSLIDPDLASGDVHMLIGTLLLVPGLFMFLGLVWTLNRVIADDAPKVVAKAKPAKPAKVAKAATVSPASPGAAASGASSSAGSSTTLPASTPASSPASSAGGAS